MLTTTRVFIMLVKSDFSRCPQYERMQLTNKEKRRKENMLLDNIEQHKNNHIKKSKHNLPKVTSRLITYLKEQSDSKRRK